MDILLFHLFFSQLVFAPSRSYTGAHTLTHIGWLCLAFVYVAFMRVCLFSNSQCCIYMCDASSITCVHPLTFFKYFQRPTSLFECVIFRSIPLPNRHKWYLLKCITNYRRTTKCNRFSLDISFDHFAEVFFRSICWYNDINKLKLMEPATLIDNGEHFSLSLHAPS